MEINCHPSLGHSPGPSCRHEMCQLIIFVALCACFRTSSASIPFSVSLCKLSCWNLNKHFWQMLHTMKCQTAWWGKKCLFHLGSSALVVGREMNMDCWLLPVLWPLHAVYPKPQHSTCIYLQNLSATSGVGKVIPRTQRNMGFLWISNLWQFFWALLQLVTQGQQVKGSRGMSVE